MGTTIFIATYNIDDSTPHISKALRSMDGLRSIRRAGIGESRNAAEHARASAFAVHGRRSVRENPRQLRIFRTPFKRINQLSRPPGGDDAIAVQSVRGRPA